MTVSKVVQVTQWAIFVETKIKCEHVDSCTHVRTYTRTQAHVHIHPHMHAHIHAFKRMYARTLRCIRVHELYGV